MPNSSEPSLSILSRSGDSTPQIYLSLQKLGEVTSFKNSKMIARGRLITDPKKQRKMESYIQSFESQLRSLWRTSVQETGTECSLASWIRSSMPLDDSRQWIPQMSVRFLEVNKGHEGAIVNVERL